MQCYDFVFVQGNFFAYVASNINSLGKVVCLPLVAPIPNFDLAIAPSLVVDCYLPFIFPDSPIIFAMGYVAVGHWKKTTATKQYTTDLESPVLSSSQAVD